MSEGNPERIGVFGGSFDPVHMGHLTIAQDAVEQLELDRLIFVPAAVPPHKQEKALTEGRHRFEMLQLATEGNLDAFFRGETMVNEICYQCSKDSCSRKKSGKCF
jgi:cytidyltransferase-like protein